MARKTNKQILIITEGTKTEPNYFNRIKQSGDIKEGYSLKVKPFAKSPLQMVQEAAKEKNNYDKVWVVFDHDNQAFLNEAFTLAERNNIQIAFSAISFEIWILLHFTYSTRPFQNSEEVIKEIKKHIDAYNKNYERLYDDTKAYLKQARANAQKLRNSREDTTLRIQNPFVDVDMLIDEIIAVI